MWAPDPNTIERAFCSFYDACDVCLCCFCSTSVQCCDASVLISDTFVTLRQKLIHKLFEKLTLIP